MTPSVHVTVASEWLSEVYWLKGKKIVTCLSVTAFFWTVGLSLEPQLVLSDQYGHKHQLLPLTTAYTVVDFSASWSKTSWAALPDLEKLASSFPQCTFYLVNEDEDIALRDTMVSQLDLSIPVIWDKNHRFAERIQPRGLPATLILDQKGQIVYQHLGFSRQKCRELYAMLEKLLNQKEKTR